MTPLAACLVVVLAAAANLPAAIGPKSLTEPEAVRILSGLLEASAQADVPAGHCIFIAGPRTCCAVLAEKHRSALAGEWEEGTRCPRVERDGTVARCICGDTSATKECPGEVVCTCNSPGNVATIECR